LLALVGDQNPREILAATPAAVAALIAGTSVETRSVRPAPGRWSLNEIVAHLADSELVAGYRLRMIASANGTPLQAFDQDRWASALDYRACDAAESTQLFTAYRRGTLRMLSRLAPELMGNHGLHEERGVETIEHLIRLYAGHDRNHLQQIERLLADVGFRSAFQPAPPRPEIPFDVVEQVDLRVGTIVKLEPVPKAARLMRLTVDFGDDTRHVIAGIREERVDPSALAGRQALFYYNVRPRTILGEKSEAMLCDVGHADGLLPALLEPEWPVPNGTRAG
jgi:tRNA-binding protein